MFNQAYFMPLFYFISAYFTPSSYAKGKELFIYHRARRIWLPAIFVSFVISPLSGIIAQCTSSSRVYYSPTAGPAWFLYWLLIFDWMYSTYFQASLQNTSSNDDDDTEEETPFPSLPKCWISGGLICGLGMQGFSYAVSWYPFYNMTISSGSFINNLFFFLMGIYASSQSKWTSQLSLVWPLQYLTLFIEAMILIGLEFLLQDMHALLVVYAIIAGVFCVDMSMVVLHFFHRFLDFYTEYSHILSQSAYTVYLIHPLVITSLTSIYVLIYNKVNGYNVIEFDHNAHSSSELLGQNKGSLHLFAGFVFIFLMTNVICWPVAWALKKLPMFKGIL